ncbi:V-type ATP synthase subunit A [Imhoffiella purpurea]|uniref:V-type ATP synthase alpha chain n=1 Tax=Imhoffiella purpurea TaxID=1249627 RepID=W9V3P0_9GAMM|nr:V-type ATP synthase subunit A [Imhoffiella purpurea]EXJ14133.1 V-type ATP synthase subunit A [Imhoffiella purpurea]
MSRASAIWVSGPVMRARPEGSFQLRESVTVGERRLLGEVIRIARDEITVQLYEDTSGLRPGVLVEGTGRPLSVRLGPGILSRIFDGLLRPIGDPSDPYVQPGLCRIEPQRFHFEPGVRVGDRVSPGGSIGTLSNGTALDLRCLIPPGHPPGEVVEILDAGRYLDDEPLCRLRADDGSPHAVTMSHEWPVRVPRPVAARLPSDQPMLTGQRLIDCLFPVARGGTGAIPGGFGTGKTVLLETVAKWCDADLIVYVGCGERGNEMAGLLAEFSELEDPRTGRPLMERTLVIANTSNMPVSAREASIYTGITVAEYFRDQGLAVTLMADSTSRWAEALREVSGRLGELPGEGGYPAYLSSRLADFYERAARVRTLGGDLGSVTLLGAVSPPSGDFSEPVTTHTKRYVGCLWGLDAKRAQARFYPAINPLNSYSLVAERLARWWHTQGCTRWQELRSRFLTLLEEESRLERMARIIGRDAMPARQRALLICAQLVNEGFLRQSAFSENDRYASPERQAVMMRLIGSFLEGTERLLDAGIAPERIAEDPVYRRLTRMGEEIPDGDWDAFAAIDRELTAVVRRLIDAGRESGEGVGDSRDGTDAM